MSDYRLMAATEAASELASMFTPGFDSDPLSLTMEVREDRCFGERWVSVGVVSLHPRPAPVSVLGESPKERLRDAFRYGFFEWRIPPRDTIRERIESVLGIKQSAKTHGTPKTADGKPKKADRQDRDLTEIVRALPRIAIRCGLASPVLDPMILSRLPFREPVVITMDTSAVLEGGLDFVGRHILPAARISVPAVVHMEVLNFSERFLSARRQRHSSPGTLRDHIQSQSGQRALLRLASNPQVERPRLGADPVRGLVEAEQDPEDKRLRLHRVLRGFADRLILETAIQRKREALPGTPVMLMTADQGLARMAVAEGIEPIFIQSDSVDSLFDMALSGVPFRPFTTNGSRTYPVPFASLLWECAVTFGSARIRNEADQQCFEVAAIGEKLSWRPHHAREDILWVRTVAGVEKDELRRKSQGGPATARQTPTRRSGPTVRRMRTGAYRFRPASMLRLVSRLTIGPLSDDEGLSLTETKSPRSYDQYYQFLVAGGMAIRDGDRVEGTDTLLRMNGALLGLDYRAIRDLLCRVPSLGAFLEALDQKSPITRETAPVRESAFSGYCAFAEMCCAGVRFGPNALLATPAYPVPDTFVELALRAYESVRHGKEFALTGEWLEHLATEDRIHPVIVRDRLAEAHQARTLRRFFEGSTPETRYRDRSFQVLEIVENQPQLRPANLYYGDFLLRGRASTRIRVERWPS